ncbi:focadhesin [Ochlerotatus camptorhynchus]|uniref:focadhesin n=1 Tax=Ochlerotatus camptorhynchus TaxID=644619 RepID=UPI0031DC3F23
MDDFKQIGSKCSVLATASAIHKALKLITERRTKTGGKSGSAGTNEVELLKSLCKSDNPQTAQLAVQALFHLVSIGSLDLGQTLGILVTALANSSPAHLSAVGNGMFELLLLDLRRRCLALGEEKYVCQFDLKPPQHPLILLLGTRDVVNVLSFGTKVNEICHHHDQLIRKNSIEFLRPVFLHVFNNTVLFPETQKMWRALLMSSVNDEAAVSMIYDIVAWSKTSTGDKCLYTNNLLLEALEFYSLENKRFDCLRMDICLYLAAVSKELIGFNYDPSENFLKILSTLHAVKGEHKMINYNSVLLMILADLLQSLAPAHILGLMRIVRFLLESGCNRLSQLMILDGAVQLLGQQTFVQNYLEDCNFIMHTVVGNRGGNEVEDYLFVCPAGFFHQDIAKYSHFCMWWNRVKIGQHSVTDFLEAISQNVRFSEKIDLVIRGLFYMKELPYEDWRKVFDQLVMCSRSSEERCSRILTPILFSLANDTNPHKRLYLLRSLASMGAKDHVLGVLKALAKDVDRATSLDLYLRLWKAEPRTYPFLYDVLKDTSRRAKEDPWETTLARTYTIREVCLIKPHQHGADLVNLFSEILSRPEDVNNEAAVALAIDAIASLCENHVVNIVSTWKVLGFKFTHEKRPRIIRSLCRFFANVPSIKVNSLEQERLVNEIILKLWQFVTDFDDREVIVAALESLKSFPPEMMNIFHIPDIFRQGIPLPSEDDDSLEARRIPGECWIQLIHFVNHSAIEQAGNLVAHHVHNEMQTYRGGVYLMPEGRPEPTSLRHFPKSSILAAVIHYLINHGGKMNASDTNDLVLFNLLRIVAKKYPKPIPPLDWCFLHEYFHHCFEAKKYCLRIAIKQMPVSGTAKRIVENYLSEAVENDMEVEDVLVVLEFLNVITESVQTDIYKRYVHLALQFLLERSEDVKENEKSPFLTVVENLKAAILKKTYQNEENFEYLCETLENLFSRFNVNTPTFDEYVKVLSVLPSKHLTSLLKPSTWLDKRNQTKLEKVIFLQFSIHKHNPTATDLHLLGLSDILKSMGSFETEARRYFLRSFFDFVPTLENHKALNGWIIELIGYIQSNLAEQQSHQMKEVILLLDVFFIAVISLSGYGALLGNETVVENLDMRFSIFPPSLIMVFRLNLWREIENKIYEFLYHLYNHPSISAPYAECFRNALLCCKEQSYFQQSKAWPKFVSLRRL